ncbi:hypothetical protein IC229_27520 [Spirosoma sp. BT702]|uniref:Uncharacterized protein n=1 Tax=Spirosoma profusum TaxID=2771354 RepID=A0A926Y5E9_9BACT|nr:hypothetical protein [Spirosoma profusum]MBD2704421.1 hypothetical protein [Spirosoma profusum]
MALPTFKAFNLTALRPNGDGLSGAQIRILNATSVDVTNVLFNSMGIDVAPFTDTFGKVNKVFLSTFGLPSGQVYTIQVLARGYEPWSVTTDTTFIGAGAYTANLTRSTVTVGAYSVTNPGAGFMSAMTPLVCMAESPGDYEWEYIRATVGKSNGDISAIESPVHKTDLTTRIDIRNRLNLGVRPLLVDTGLTRDDTDFSDKVEVSFTSLSEEGEAEIPLGFIVSVAQTLPPDGETDLNKYAAPALREWIVPAQPVIAFRGYYRDVSIWLAEDPDESFQLVTTYYNAAGGEVSTTTDDVNQSDYVQRIRVNTDPAATVEYAVLQIFDGEQAATKPLTIEYRG